MDVDAVLLSRFQFAWVIAFHILLLPAFTVGLSCFIARSNSTGGSPSATYTGVCRPSG